MSRMYLKMRLLIITGPAVLAGLSVEAANIPVNRQGEPLVLFQKADWGQPPAPDPDPVAKNRYISFIPANAGQETAIRVRMTSLHRPGASDSAPDFTAMEGQYRYVNAITMCRGGTSPQPSNREPGNVPCYSQADCDARSFCMGGTEPGGVVCASQSVCAARGLGGTCTPVGGACEQMHTCTGGTEPGGALCGDQEDCHDRGFGGTCVPSLTCPESEVWGTTFKCTRFSCSPEYRDWAAETGGEVLHVVDPAVVPSSRYDVAQLDSACQGTEETCAAASAELAVLTALWGNVDDDPQLNVLDVAAVVDKVKEQPDALRKPRAQLQPHSVNPFANVNVLDVANTVDALKDRPYPFTGPAVHQCIPLRDSFGTVLTVDAAAPYSGAWTCGVGACHDSGYISNGFHFQQGRTDLAGDIIMGDDAFDDGRWWIRSAGMYGRWAGGSGGFNRQMAGKSNVNESVMDLTTFGWVANCGECHVGGGAAEFDRDGERLYGYYEDTDRFEFGYERLGLTPGEVALDGDYAVIDESSGSVGPARWDLAGVAEPECLHCHRIDRVWEEEQPGEGKDMHREWRAAVLGTTTRLVDGEGAHVQAFAAAGTAGQGWFSTLDTEVDPPVLQIDYAVGVGNGSLLQNSYGSLSVPESLLTRQPIDRACWGCHLPGGGADKRGMVWFDERDVHYKKFTNRSDEDLTNDVPDDRAIVCSHCHVGALEHNLSKGNSPYIMFRSELDWVGFKSCRECHLTFLPDGMPNPDKEPDAPDVPGTVTVHLIGFYEGETGPMRTLSCQACHVPYPLDRGVIATDWSLTGMPIEYYTDEFLSADPLDPTDPDTSKWYPNLRPKVDSDGLVRYFPQKTEIAVYWADWNRNNTPADYSDDTIQPIILWRLGQITGGAALPGVTDDSGDGKLEVNTPAEMLLYMQALKGNDSYGRPVAGNPVLVKGSRVWYEEPPGNVNWFDYEQAGIPVEPFEHYGLDHNVLLATEAWGVGGIPTACNVCHDSIPPYESPVIDRKILVDPFGVDGQPVYKTIRELTGLNPS